MKTVHRVVCAVSGGVDSAVSALLLKQRGFQVVGVHMTNWDPQDEADDTFSCPQTKDRADAKALCEHLDIKLHSVNFVKEYWSEVFSKFLDNYQRGITVVPDVECNRVIKFDLLRRFAFEKLSADAIATGHFARTSRGDFLENQANCDDFDKVKLLRSKDPLKDQTYFLSSLDHTQLQSVMFPVGSLFKTEVKRMAASQLPEFFATKRESFGICFVGPKKRHFDEFLNKYIDPVENGSFVDIDDPSNEAFHNARHKGVHHFTLGKRINFGAITSGAEKLRGDSTTKLYVAGLDPQKQIVYACRNHFHPKLYAKRILVSTPHWIAGETDFLSRFDWGTSKVDGTSPLRVTVQRTHSPVLCQLRMSETAAAASPFWEVQFRTPIRATAPGQICVFYAADECLGYSQIERVVETL